MGRARRLPVVGPRWAIGAVVLCLVAGMVTWQVVQDRSALTPEQVDGSVHRQIVTAVEKARRDQRAAPPDAAAAYRAILPSLVTVTTAAAGPATATTATAPAPTTGNATASAKPAPDGETVGAGVVVNADGAILTALHVVEGGGAIRVTFADGTQATAQVANRQPATDIAVLQVDRLPQVVVPAVLGGGAQVGDAVFPVGNPLGLTGTLSAGVVSALDRSIRTRTGTALDGLIQFDAAVNPGSSGGPLLDRDGQVIGIVTGLANPAQQPYFVGIGFAVPIATAGGAAGGPAK